MFTDRVTQARAVENPRLGARALHVVQPDRHIARRRAEYRLPESPLDAEVAQLTACNTGIVVGPVVVAHRAPIAAVRHLDAALGEYVADLLLRARALGVADAQLAVRRALDERHDGEEAVSPQVVRTRQQLDPPIERVRPLEHEVEGFLEFVRVVVAIHAGSVVVVAKRRDVIDVAADIPPGGPRRHERRDGHRDRGVHARIVVRLHRDTVVGGDADLEARGAEQAGHVRPLGEGAVVNRRYDHAVLYRCAFAHRGVVGRGNGAVLQARQVGVAARLEGNLEKVAVVVANVDRSTVGGGGLVGCSTGHDGDGHRPVRLVDGVAGDRMEVRGRRTRREGDGLHAFTVRFHEVAGFGHVDADGERFGQDALACEQPGSPVALRRCLGFVQEAAHRPRRRRDRHLGRVVVDDRHHGGRRCHVEGGRRRRQRDFDIAVVHVVVYRAEHDHTGARCGIRGKGQRAARVRKLEAVRVGGLGAHRKRVADIQAARRGGRDRRGPFPAIIVAFNDVARGDREGQARRVAQFDDARDEVVAIKFDDVVRPVEQVRHVRARRRVDRIRRRRPARQSDDEALHLLRVVGVAHRLDAGQAVDGPETRSAAGERRRGDGHGGPRQGREVGVRPGRHRFDIHGRQRQQQTASQGVEVVHASDVRALREGRVPHRLEHGVQRHGAAFADRDAVRVDVERHEPRAIVVADVDPRRPGRRGHPVARAGDQGHRHRAVRLVDVVVHDRGVGRHRGVRAEGQRVLGVFGRRVHEVSFVRGGDLARRDLDDERVGDLA